MAGARAAGTKRGGGGTSKRGGGKVTALPGALERTAGSEKKQAAPEFVWLTAAPRNNAGQRRGAWAKLHLWEGGKQRVLVVSADVRDALLGMGAHRVIVGLAGDGRRFALAPAVNPGDGVKLCKQGGMWGISAGMLTGLPAGRYAGEIGASMIQFEFAAPFAEGEAAPETPQEPDGAAAGGAE